MITNEYINRAIDYILNHIDEEITVEDISNYCCFSRYYFSRIFKMETGESIYEFIKRVRMERSAFRLKVEKDRSITDIGSAYGYSSSNYSSAFKKHHNMPPYKFRRSIVHKSMMNPVFRNTQTELLTWQECSEKFLLKCLRTVRLSLKDIKEVMAICPFTGELFWINIRSILRNRQEFWNVPMTIRQLHSLTNVFAISVSMLRQDAPLKISVR